MHHDCTVVGLAKKVRSCGVVVFNDEGACGHFTSCFGQAPTYKFILAMEVVLAGGCRPCCTCFSTFSFLQFFGTKHIGHVCSVYSMLASTACNGEAKFGRTRAVF